MPQRGEQAQVLAPLCQWPEPSRQDSRFSGASLTSIQIQLGFMNRLPLRAVVAPVVDPRLPHPDQRRRRDRRPQHSRRSSPARAAGRPHRAPRGRTPPSRRRSASRSSGRSTPTDFALEPLEWYCATAVARSARRRRRGGRTGRRSRRAAPRGAWEYAAVSIGTSVRSIPSTSLSCGCTASP